MRDLPDVIAWSIPAFLLLIVVERLSYLLHRDDDEVGYGSADTATSLAMGLGSIGTDLLWKIPIAAAYALLYAVTPARIGTPWWSWPLLLVVQDFCYYWSHRSHHVVRILWACHVVHHSSQRFNLSTALRQPWTGLTAWVFYLPLILAGVHPAVPAFCSSVNLLYQFWIHTEHPLRVAFHEYATIGRDLRAASSWRDRIGHLVRSPGWRPAGAATVTAAVPAPRAERTSSVPG